MLQSQRCYLLFAGDMPDDAKGYRSIKDARAAFAKVANELARYGQAIEASVHFVDDFESGFAEYPDRTLSLSERGAIVESRT